MRARDYLLAGLAKSEGATPPDAVRSACRRGLALAAEFGGPGLTEGAKARARSMAAGEAQTPEQLSRLSRFFSRHQQNRADPSAKEPTPGAVAWLIWGGDAGRSWASEQGGDSTDKADRPKLVAGNTGAWRHAEKQARGKRNPAAYRAAVFARITKKSTQETFVPSTAFDIYQRAVKPGR